MACALRHSKRRIGALTCANAVLIVCMKRTSGAADGERRARRATWMPPGVGVRGYRARVTNRSSRGAAAGSANHLTAPKATPREAVATDTTVEVRRSARRRRTVSAYRDGDRTVILLPARMSRADEQRWVDVMLKRLAAQERRRTGQASRGDAELANRATELANRYFDGRTRPTSVRWVTNQLQRWGSCTPSDGTIRLSDRLRAMPSWVIDYVLVHELAHLIEIGHGPRFQALVDRYPMAERARGYLIGFTDAGGDPGQLNGESEVDEPEAVISTGKPDAVTDRAAPAPRLKPADEAPAGLW
jgi:predicted metal-dependent hydrolase